MFQRLVPKHLSLFAGVAALLPVLGLVAVLQYRWVGQVGEAERVRLEAGLRHRLAQLAEDFDREITRAYAWLQVDADMLEPGGGGRFAARYEAWAERTEHAGLVRGVYVLERSEPPRLQRFDPGSRRFVEAGWPTELLSLRERLETSEPGRPLGGPGPRPREPGPRPPEPGGPGFRGPPGFVTDDGPALVISIAPPMGRLGPGFGPPRSTGLTLVLLDRAYIHDQLLPELTRRYFATGGELDYRLVVTRRREPREVVYRSDPDESARAIAETGLFEVRFDLVESGALTGGDVAVPTRMLRRGPEGRGPGPPGARRGLWEAGVLHPAGSLEDVVARTRRRNLAVSFGTLLLLGASVALIVLSSQRARRLAAQQVEFVAGVSHELRTPVAVVCSAGENLADGLVRDPAEVRLYGATIRDEGRRLAEMVEQVLEYAGIASRERQRAREPVPVKAWIEETLEACRAALRENALEVEVRVPPDLPPLLGDRAALRRALQNLVLNAVKHARTGRWIGISAQRAGSGRGQAVRVSVSDHGPGIPAGEERRIFEAFYRGRQARAAGISGSGLGLSLVRRIVEAHGGTVELESTAGVGSAFTLVLPVARREVPPGNPVVEGGDAQADPAR